MSNPKPKSGPRGLCAWLREHLQPSAAPRVSHTRVKVLSGTAGETWSSPFSRGNTLSSGQGFPGVRGGEVNDNAMNVELSGHSKQNGALKTSAAPGSSGKPSKKKRSFLQRFPCCRGNRRTGKVAPMLHPKGTTCSKNSQESGNQNLILHDLDDGDYSCTKQTEVSACGKVIVEHLSCEKRCLQSSLNSCKIPQGKNSDFQSEDKKLTGKSQGKKTFDRNLERQTYSTAIGSKQRKAPNKRSTSKFLGHGDNRCNTAQGFLLHTKPSRGGRHYTNEEKPMRVEIPNFDPTALKRNSQSPVYDALKMTENDREDENKLPNLAGGSNNSLENSQNREQEGTEIPEVVGRSHTRKQLRNTKFITEQDASKMARPKTCQGILLLNESIGDKTRQEEECTFFNSLNCTEDNKAAQVISATGQDRHELKVSYSDPKKSEHVVNIWRNNFNDCEEPDQICEGKGFQQSLMKSASQPATYDIWRRSDAECEETKRPEVSEGKNITPLTADYNERETTTALSANRSCAKKPGWFTEYNTKSCVSKSAKPIAQPGLGATEVTSVRRQADKFGFWGQETCSVEKNIQHPVECKHFSLKDLGSYCCPERKQLHIDIWRNDFGKSDEERVGKSDIDTNQEEDIKNLQSSAYQTENLICNEELAACTSSIRTAEITKELEELEEFEALEKALENEEIEIELFNDDSEHSVVDSEERELDAKEFQELNVKQKEQWELAALGEWSLVCHDDEEDEESTNLYLMKDELLKEQEVRHNLESIIFQFQDLPVIKDFQKMLTVPGCPMEQIERALRQYARICRGPVPLSESGQSKAEAVASLSVNLHRQTKRFLKEPQSSFRVIAGIMEELDILRERQDSVEVSLKRDLRKGNAGKQMVRTSRSGRWSADARELPWKLNRRIIDIYMSQSGIKSSCRVDVMPSIPELSGTPNDEGY